MFNKVLIANRGEIALRIIRACNELDIRSVAIYSDIDRYALHVKHADESVNIGPESLQSYLNAHRIVNAAKSRGCDAIHPGYGFLSENAEFAELCTRAGLTFIGPSSELIAKMGDKVMARKLMSQAGIPVIAGSESSLQNVEEALSCAESIGYPIMLKATTGGGGRGLRRCDDVDSLKQNYQRVISEASKAFASTEVFLEKYIEQPRHIEVQILADQHGHVIHLFERDCSIQRRHQKLIEIAPSPQLTTQQRETVCNLAVKAAKTVGYDNIGTMEFIFDQTGQFYFLEMNTRLQVEHPVTEMITGVDLVIEQMRSAAGEHLRLQQQDIQLNGQAIEFRINAEDPEHDFIPSFGKITRYYAPGGPGVRTDSAIYTGYELPNAFDSLCAKLCVWHDDWPSVLQRAKRALKEVRMHGIKTTISYYLAMVQDPDFIKAKLDTGFIDAHPQLLHQKRKRAPQHYATAVAAALSAYFSAMEKS